MRAKSNPSRRTFLRAAAATSVASSPLLAASNTTQPADTLPSGPISLDDIAATCRVLGHNYTAAEQQMMADGLSDRRELLEKMRRRIIDPRTEPAMQFNPRLADVKYPTGADQFSLSDAPIPEYDGNIDSLAFATAADLSRLIHAKKVTSTQLTKMYLSRLDTIGRKLNAVVNLTGDLALKQAKRADDELAAGKSRGPLHGLPYGAKDLLATTNIPTTWGVKPFEHRVLDYDATVVEKLEAAGAVLCAKLSLGELAMGDVWFGGQTKCPWNMKEGSGGSSAGPAATVAAGCVAFSIGSETLGSIISPCMINGVTGLRPTYGRVSRYGAMSLSRSMDKLGPICRGVEDGAMILSAIHGPDDRDPTAARNTPFNWQPNAPLSSLRIGYDVLAFEEMAKSKNAKKRDIYHAALESLRGLAGELTPVQLPSSDAYSGLAGLTIAVEAAMNFTELVESGHIRDLVQQDAGSWPNTFRRGSLVPGCDYLRAQQLRSQLMRDMHEAMRDVDLYITIPYSGPTLSFTNLTGHPTLISRCGMLNGRPVMIEFLGRLYREDAILRLGFEYERSASWNQTWPKVSA